MNSYGSRRLLHKLLTTNGPFKTLINNYEHGQERTVSNHTTAIMKNAIALMYMLICILNVQLHAGFSELPPEVKTIIVTSLIYSYSCNEIAPCVKDIQSLSHVDRLTRIFINGEQATSTIIGELIKKFGMDNIDVAVLLATPGAVAWLKHVITINKEQEQLVESLLINYAGQEESPESIIKIKILLKAGVNVNAFQERKLGVLDGVVERITPLAAAQKKGNKQVEKLLLSHPQIDLGFKAVRFNS